MSAIKTTEIEIGKLLKKKILDVIQDTSFATEIKVAMMKHIESKLAYEVAESLKTPAATQLIKYLTTLNPGYSELINSIAKFLSGSGSGGAGLKSLSIGQSGENLQGDKATFENSMKMVSSMLGDAANNPIFKVACGIVNNGASKESFDSGNIDVVQMMKLAQEEFHKKVNNKEIDVKALADETQEAVQSFGVQS
ncbi:hypothetical protein M427DRAFT_44843 [Gonapodya prolifera JEL478]|uniref:Uncharacterized protein n=1 Tax=Gonapodya prolifera (strain JEL478) TaxID=1344416 RepID=A0A139AEL9_GONPJ|nr:hypothetical protein M427DRAFT_44843 [Gonapodya prolifera JEL478]|eukprot:KXS14885.1 hypothetical protein M427DRAFT_44843 [Gonapodya prolifera JEL478]